MNLLRPIRTEAPAEKPVTLDEAKAHCRVDHSDDDALIEAYLDTAIAYLDGWSGILGRCMISQKWSVSGSCWPYCSVSLPYPDISAVAVKYRDSLDVEQPLAETTYRLLEGHGGSMLEWDPSFSSPSLYMRGDAIRFEMTAGYGATATDVPAPLRHAIKLLVGQWYETREPVALGVSVADLPFTVMALISPYRRIGI